jgi:hypothetical protein
VWRRIPAHVSEHGTSRFSWISAVIPDPVPPRAGVLVPRSSTPDFQGRRTVVHIRCFARRLPQRFCRRDRASERASLCARFVRRA